jgi:hypothetical protein
MVVSLVAFLGPLRSGELAGDEIGLTIDLLPLALAPVAIPALGCLMKGRGRARWLPPIKQRVSDPFIEAFRFEETKKRVEPVLGVFPGFGIEGDFAGGGVVIDEADFERVSVRSVEGNATGAKGFRPLLEGHRARSAIDASGLRGFGTLGIQRR